MATTKICTTCKNRQPLESFYKHRSTKDGFSGKCKECTKIYTREWYRSHIGYFKVYNKKRMQDPKKRAAAYARINADRKRKPEKWKARVLLHQAIYRKEVTKPNKCESCGKASRLQGHHADYTKPLSVVWLCAPCHRQEHGRSVIPRLTK